MINVYCDESCHLQNDQSDIMTIGCLYCDKTALTKLNADIGKIKDDHGIARDNEIKWTKVSPGKIDYYLALVEYFFASPALHFRGVVAMGKKSLDHDRFDQSHDDWYYKMYYLLIGKMLNPAEKYNIYIDIKDTQGGYKIQRLQNFLNVGDEAEEQEPVQRIQLIRSHESTPLQLADLLIGALSYHHRRLDTQSLGKSAVIDLIKAKTGTDLGASTHRSEDKFNLFIWTPQGVGR